MKKFIIFLISIVIIIATISFVQYHSYKTEYSNILKENAEFEEYKEKEIYGTELGTLINKTIDKNTKNKIEKDEFEEFIANEKDSIKIDIFMKDNEKIYKMEKIYNAGMEQFIRYYGNIKFKCSKIEYHKTTGKIKYLLFEQIVTS